MSKRTLIIVIICLVIILGVGAYFILNKSKTTTTTTQSVTNNTSPFGNAFDTFTTTPTTATSTSTVFKNSSGIPQLIKIVNAPTANGAFVTSNNHTDIYFVDRITGHTFRTNPANQTLTRITNTTIPNISRSLWTKNGANVIMQYVSDDETINTYAAKIASVKEATSSNVSHLEIQGQYLPKNIQAITLSPSTAKAFYLVPTTAGTDGYIANPDGTKASKLISLPLRELTVYWPTESTIVIATKPSANVPGYAYTVNAKTGATNRIIAGITGLSILPDPSGLRVAYTDNSNALRVMTISDASVSTTPVSTLADICVWSSKVRGLIFCAVPQTIATGNYPDDWYQGLTSFNDNIVKINTVTNEATVLVNPLANYNQAIDATDLSLSPNEDYLLFTNKRDYSLWTVNLGN